MLVLTLMGHWHRYLQVTLSVHTSGLIRQLVHTQGCKRLLGSNSRHREASRGENGYRRRVSANFEQAAPTRVNCRLKGPNLPQTTADSSDVLQ